MKRFGFVAVLAILLAATPGAFAARSPTPPGIGDDISDFMDFCFLVNGELTQQKNGPIAMYSCDYASGDRSITVTDNPTMVPGKIFGRLTTDAIKTPDGYQKVLAMMRRKEGFAETSCYVEEGDCYSFKRTMRRKHVRLTTTAKLVWWPNKVRGVAQMMQMVE